MDKKLTCGQTVIPQVDNSSLGCEAFISDKCIVVSESIPELGTQQNSSLILVIMKLVAKINVQNKLIKQMRADINNLKK